MAVTVIAITIIMHRNIYRRQIESIMNMDVGGYLDRDDGRKIFLAFKVIPKRIRL